MNLDRWTEDNEDRHTCPDCGGISYTYTTEHRQGCPVAAKNAAQRQEQERWCRQRAGVYRCGCVVTVEGGLVDICLTSRCEVLRETYRRAAPHY